MHNKYSLHLNHSQTIPTQSMEKIVFHKTSPEVLKRLGTAAKAQDSYKIGCCGLGGVAVFLQMVRRLERGKRLPSLAGTGPSTRFTDVCFMNIKQPEARQLFGKECRQLPSVPLRPRWAAAMLFPASILSPSALQGGARPDSKDMSGSSHQGPPHWNLVLPVG